MVDVCFRLSPLSLPLRALEWRCCCDSTTTFPEPTCSHAAPMVWIAPLLLEKPSGSDPLVSWSTSTHALLGIYFTRRGPSWGHQLPLLPRVKWAKLCAMCQGAWAATGPELLQPSPKHNPVELGSSRVSPGNDMNCRRACLL